jgi:hypothetical protein
MSSPNFHWLFEVTTVLMQSRCAGVIVIPFAGCAIVATPFGGVFSVKQPNIS